jgi:type VI secretion system protein ImpC
MAIASVSLALAEFTQQLAHEQAGVQTDLESIINARIADFDKLISAQLNEVMHAVDFQRLEASWRGLHYLVSETETSATLKIRVLNVSKNELLGDLEKAPEFDQSALFTKVYTEEFGTFGGQPFGAFIGDYEFSHDPQDLLLLKKISAIAAAAHAPFIAAASPKLFSWDDFTDLANVRDLTKIFDKVEYAPWTSFRGSEDSRYVALCLPHMLLRSPFGRETMPTETFVFEEDVDGTDHRKYLWATSLMPSARA